MSNAEAHCPMCCQHFTSDHAFDRHLAHPQSRDWCYDPSTLRDRLGRKVFKLVQRASGPTWTTRRDKPHPFAKADVDGLGALSSAGVG